MVKIEKTDGVMMEVHDINFYNYIETDDCPQLASDINDFMDNTSEEQFFGVLFKILQIRKSDDIEYELNKKISQYKDKAEKYDKIINYIN